MRSLIPCSWFTPLLLSGSLLLPASETLANPYPPLTPQQITTQLTQLPNWQRQDKTLTRTFEFGNFIESVDFVEQLVGPAEELGHHPDVDIRYSRVIITLTTHDIGGIGPLDIALAKTINAIYPPDKAE